LTKIDLRSERVGGRRGDGRSVLRGLDKKEERKEFEEMNISLDSCTLTPSYRIRFYHHWFLRGNSRELMEALLLNTGRSLSRSVGMSQTRVPQFGKWGRVDMRHHLEAVALLLKPKGKR
jgi:hypothetical protein